LKVQKTYVILENGMNTHAVRMDLAGALFIE